MSVFLLVALLMTLLFVFGGHLFFVWLLRDIGTEETGRCEASRGTFWKALERWRRDKPRAIEDRRARSHVRS